MNRVIYALVLEVSFLLVGIKLLERWCLAVELTWGKLIDQAHISTACSKKKLIIEGEKNCGGDMHWDSR